tara:strand:- start:523 stop:753 length:231 start_codon:yes stop_codon:yes gene_type:complete
MSKKVEFRMINEEEMPPIVISINDDDMPKVVINSHYTIWLSLHRKTIGGCAENLFVKINELLDGYLAQQRAYEGLD